MKPYSFLTTHAKTNSKWINNLNTRTKNHKTLRKQANLHNFGFGNIFLDVTPKAQKAKEKIVKLKFIKIINFCASTDITETKMVTYRKRASIWKSYPKYLKNF